MTKGEYAGVTEVTGRKNHRIAEKSERSHQHKYTPGFVDELSDQNASTTSFETSMTCRVTGRTRE